MILPRLRKFIEQNRKSKNIFFVLLVGIKDIIYDLLVTRLSRIILYVYKVFGLKNKYNIVFVVARYKENVNWLKNLPYKYVLYDKGPDPKASENFYNKKNKDTSNCIDFIKLQNVGREAHTYLTYIVDNYNSLPDYVGFLQADPFVHAILLTNKIYKFKGQDYYPLSPKMEYENAAVEYIRNIEGSTLKYFGIQRPIGSFPFGAQFIVSKKKILEHDFAEYKFLLKKLIEAEKTKSECAFFENHKKPCTCLNEISAWVLEVWWPIIFEEDRKVIIFE